MGEWDHLYDEDENLIPELVMNELRDFSHYVACMEVIVPAITGGKTFRQCSYSPEVVLELHALEVEQLILDTTDNESETQHDYRD